MAITRTRLNGSSSKQLVSAAAKKLLGITPIILKSDSPAMQLSNIESRDSRIYKWKPGDHFIEEFVPDYDQQVKVWDAASTGGATGEPLLTAKLAWTPGVAQAFIPVTSGLVIQTPIECVVIWDT